MASITSIHSLASAAGSATVERLADAVDGALGELVSAQQVAAGEDSAEILALAAREGRRIGAVSSSVPKIEGAVSQLSDRGDKLGSTGMELSKLTKDVVEVLAGAMLRSGRRTRRLGLEIGAAIAPFAWQRGEADDEPDVDAGVRTGDSKETAIAMQETWRFCRGESWFCT